MTHLGQGADRCGILEHAMRIHTMTDPNPHILRCAALVTGINQYDNNPHLKNAVADAECIAKKLRELKYDVQLLKDATLDEYNDALDKIIYDPFDVVVIYFAGHGMIYANTDHVVFRDAKSMLMYEGTPASRKSKPVEKIYSEIRAQLPDAIVIAVIDACRKDMAVEGGNAEGEAERGARAVPSIGGFTKLPYQTFIAFATSPKDSTGDGIHGHSRYTAALIEEMDVLNQPIETTFKKVRKKVYSGYGSHLPWEHSCLVDEFSFNYGQNTPHLGSPYFPMGFSYDLRDRQIAKLTLIARKLLSEYSTSKIGWLYNVINDYSPTEQFLIGRQIMSALLMKLNSYESKSILADKFLRTFNYGDTNHLLNGMVYELYITDSEEERPYVSDPNIYQDLYDLINSGKYDSVKKFSSQEIQPIIGQSHWLPGKNTVTKFHLEISENELEFDNDGNHIFILDKISENGEAFNYFEESATTAISYGDFRKDLLRRSKSPAMLFSIDARDLESSDIIVKEEISEDSIAELIREYLWEGQDTTLDEFGHHFEFEDIEYIAIDSIVIENHNINLHGKLTVSATIYADSEEEIKYNVSVPGIFEIGGFQNPEINDITFSFDTTDIL